MLSNSLNRVIERYVVYHKQLEQRMDGSAGGAFSALLETAAKDDYYFSGTVYDEQLHVYHKVTNKPEDIASMAGYKPVPSDFSDAFIQIEQLLMQGEKVLFCGTSVQCQELKRRIVNTDNLLLVDIIHSSFVAQELLEKYAFEIGQLNGAKVTHIHFYNKEFNYERSKRVTLDNGRTFYSYEKDAFDDLLDSGTFSVAEKGENDFTSIEERVGDITIGNYRMGEENDHLGYSYLSINTSKGESFFARAKKRLVIIKEGEHVEVNHIRYGEYKNSSLSRIDLLKNHTLEALCGQKGNSKFKNAVRPFILGLFAARWNPFVYIKFIRINFLTKGVKTDFQNNGFVYLSGHCALKLAKSINIELHGPLSLGVRRIQESKQETRLRMESGSKMLIKHSCSFGAGSNVEIYKNAFLEIGNISSNAELTIICGLHIKTGDTCNIARNATIRDTSGHMIAIPGFKMARPVEIGNHTWICTQAIIMPGVVVGDGAIVGASSYVNKNVDSFSLVQGFPAQMVGNVKYFKI